MPGRNVCKSVIAVAVFQEKSKRTQGLNLPSSHCAQNNEIEGLLISYQTLLLHTLKKLL